MASAVTQCSAGNWAIFVTRPPVVLKEQCGCHSVTSVATSLPSNMDHRSGAELSAFRCNMQTFGGRPEAEHVTARNPVMFA
jgi:hypothetical protein